MCEHVVYVRRTNPQDGIKCHDCGAIPDLDVVLYIVISQRNKKGNRTLYCECNIPCATATRLSGIVLCKTCKKYLSRDDVAVRRTYCPQEKDKYAAARKSNAATSEELLSEYKSENQEIPKKPKKPKKTVSYHPSCILGPKRKEPRLRISTPNWKSYCPRLSVCVHSKMIHSEDTRAVYCGHCKRVVDLDEYFS